MNSPIQVVHSILSPESLALELLPNYAIDNVVNVQFISLGCNDTYLVRTTLGQQFILRIYRAGWRTVSDIAYEIDLLLHLKGKGISVSYPIPQADGHYLYPISAPEGLRHGVILTFAPGRWLDFGSDNTHDIACYAKAIAKLHNALDDFVSVHSRFELDLNYLLGDTLASLQPFILHRPDDFSYLQRLVERIQARFSALPIAQLERGHCHGDFHSGNAFISADNTITFFDFDGAGLGWRAYELAVFRWAARRNGTESLWWDTFIRNYQTERIIGEPDLQAIPLFMGIRHLWLLGLHSRNSQDWGFPIMDEYLDEHIAFLKAWEADYL